MNEEHGHQAGDEVLRQVGGALRDSVRAYDMVARYGGDEFAVIAIDADEATAAEVMRRALGRRSAGRSGGRRGSAATAGVAEWQSGETPSGLIGRARPIAAARQASATAKGGVVRASGGGDSESSSARQSRSTPASGRPKTSTSTPRAPRSSSGLVASAAAAPGPPSRSSS